MQMHQIEIYPNQSILWFQLLDPEQKPNPTNYFVLWGVSITLFQFGECVAVKFQLYAGSSRSIRFIPTCFALSNCTKKVYPQFNTVHLVSKKFLR